jgi:hypothetical protein
VEERREVATTTEPIAPPATVPIAANAPVAPTPVAERVAATEAPLRPLLPRRLLAFSLVLAAIVACLAVWRWKRGRPLLAPAQHQ